MEESLISSAAPPLLLICTKIIKTLHGVRPKLKPAPITMTSVTTECFGLHEALARVQQLESMGRQAMHASPFENVSRSITAFFYGCSMSLSVIDEYAMELNDAIQIDRPREAALHQNSDLLKFWKEKDMQELLSQIREYRKRLSDLLQAVEAGRLEPEDGHANTKDHVSIVGLVSRSRSSFLTGTDSPRSSLRDSILSLDPSPPYALSLYAYSEKAATRSTETLSHETPEPELLPQGDATAPGPADKQLEEIIDEGTTTISSNRASSEASSFSRREIRNLVSSARDNRPLMGSELYTSDHDQLVNWEDADLNSIARNAPGKSLAQLKEDIEEEPFAAGGIDERRERNFSRPLAVPSVNEIPSDEESNKPHELGRFIVQKRNGYTTYWEKKHLDPASRISSHGSTLLTQKDQIVDRKELSKSVAANTALDSTQSKDLMDQGLLITGKSRTASEVTDRNQVTYLSWMNKVAKPCPNLPTNPRYKIIVAGDDNSGRYALINQFLGRSNDDEDPGSEDFHCKRCKIDGNEITIEIVDISSQESYNSMRDAHLRSSDGFLLVYSIVSRPSFAYIINLFEKINRIKDHDLNNSHQWPKILMANHTENEALREVGREEGRSLALEKGSILIESSSKNEKTNLEAAFYHLVREICHLHNQDLYAICPCKKWIEEQQKAFAANEPPASRRSSSFREIFDWRRL